VGYNGALHTLVLEKMPSVTTQREYYKYPYTKIFYLSSKLKKITD